MTLAHPNEGQVVTSLTPTRPNSPMEHNFRCGGKEKRRLSDPEEPELARPLQPTSVPALPDGERIPDAQDCLNAIVDRTLVDETIKLLLSSLAPATQSAYLRGWKFWTRFCDIRGIKPWIDMSKPDWDMNLLTYLTWEHTVMKLGGSA